MSRVTQCWKTNAPSQVLKSNPYGSIEIIPVLVLDRSPQRRLTYIETVFSQLHSGTISNHLVLAGPPMRSESPRMDEG